MLALSTQARLAATFGELGPQHNEVLGQLTMVVDKALYQEMRRQYGDDCWKDKSFRRRFAADNPAANIRSKSRKTTVMVHASALEPVKSVPSVSSVPTPVPVCAP